MIPHFDNSVSLGNILTIVWFAWTIWLGAVKMYLLLDKRMGKFETIIEAHSTTLTSHEIRMEKHDNLSLKLVGDVQRLIGHMEATEIRRSREHP